MGCGASSPSVAYALQPEPQPPREPAEAWRQAETDGQRDSVSETETDGQRDSVSEAEAAREAERCFNLLEKALLLRICGWLSPRELGAMARVSRRFSEQMDWPSSPATGGAPAPRSVVEQAARQWVRCTATGSLPTPIPSHKPLPSALGTQVLLRPAAEQARAAAAWVDGSSWLRRMHEIRHPLAFRRSHELLLLSEQGAVATKTGAGDYTFRAAASSVPMRGGGRYHAAFTVLKYVGYTLLGVIQAPTFSARGQVLSGCDVEGKWIVHDIEGHMFYSTGTGRRCPGPRDSRSWEGAEGAEEGDTIGLLLDLDEGTLSVYKNGRKLGVMASGLTGVYCWAVSMGSEGDSIRIASVSIPEPEPEPKLQLQPEAGLATVDLLLEELTEQQLAHPLATSIGTEEHRSGLDMEYCSSETRPSPLAAGSERTADLADASAHDAVASQLMAESSQLEEERYSDRDRERQFLQLSAAAAEAAELPAGPLASTADTQREATVAHVLRSSIEEQIKSLLWPTCVSPPFCSCVFACLCVSVLRIRRLEQV